MDGKTTAGHVLQLHTVRSTKSSKSVAVVSGEPQNISRLAATVEQTGFSCKPVPNFVLAPMEVPVALRGRTKDAAVSSIIYFPSAIRTYKA